MFRHFLACCVATAMPLALAGLAPSHTKERMQCEIDVIKHVTEVRYAPRAWKEKCYGWDLDAAANIAKQRIDIYPAAEVPLKEFQRIVRDFIFTFKDYHVGVFFYSTEEASLPLQIKGIGDKYYIVYIDRKKLSPEVCPFEIGDELISFGGRPTHACVEELRNNELMSINPTTDSALAEELLVHRNGMHGHRIPRGPITLTVRSSHSGQLASYQLIWEYTPEKIKRHQYFGSAAEPTDAFEKALTHLFGYEMYAPFIADHEADHEYDGHAIAGRYSYVPTLGKMRWKTPETCSFHAYVFEMPDGRTAGYVRIPHYRGSIEEVKQFGTLVDMFQEQTNVLVIDQTNNPGGSVFYLYALASMLTDTPLVTPQHRISLSHQEAAMAATMLPHLEAINSDKDAQQVLGKHPALLHGHLATYQMTQFFIHYLHTILEQWKCGHTLSDPTHLYGVDQINPHIKHRYTKPILILTNSLDFSGGDFFPAIFQDNKRATLLGEKTAGAGGAFSTSTHFNPFGIRCYYLTSTIAERPNGQVIENVGVTPDIPYSLTARDLQERYVDYKEKILETLQQLIPSSTPAVAL